MTHCKPSRVARKRGASVRGVARPAEEWLSPSGLRVGVPNALLERLRSLKPEGRVELQLKPNSTEIPALAVEAGDRLYGPRRSLTVGVAGSVFDPSSDLYAPGRSEEQYLQVDGGPTRNAFKTSDFVVRANSEADSAPQHSGWLGTNRSFWGLRIAPGETVFSPEKLDKTTTVQDLKDWTQILYQFGLGVADIKSALGW